MNTLIIFGAKYLIFLSPLLALWALYKAPHGKRREMMLLGAIALPLTYILAKVMGHFYFDPRPFVVGGFTPLIPHLPDNGFPSDHVLLASALAAVIARFDRKTASFMWIVALLVGVSRVLAGIHHMADISGSLIIALVGTWLAYAIIRKLWNRSMRANS